MSVFFLTSPCSCASHAVLYQCHRGACAHMYHSRDLKNTRKPWDHPRCTRDDNARAFSCDPRGLPLGLYIQKVREIPVTWTPSLMQILLQHAQTTRTIREQWSRRYIGNFSHPRAREEFFSSTPRGIDTLGWRLPLPTWPKERVYRIKWGHLSLLPHFNLTHHTPLTNKLHQNRKFTIHITLTEHGINGALIRSCFAHLLPST